MMEPICPSCENKKYLSSLDLSPDVIEQMAAQEPCPDYVGDLIYNQRLKICKSCPHLIQEMTCANCGCFVQFRAKHKTAYCIEGKW